MGTLGDTGVAGLLSLLKLPQVCELLGVCERTVRELVRCGKLASVRIGRAVRFSPADVASYIDQHKGLREAQVRNG